MIEFQEHLGVTIADQNGITKSACCWAIIEHEVRTGFNGQAKSGLEMTIMDEKETRHFRSDNLDCKQKNPIF